MATFPDVLSTTYLRGSTPVVKADDLNAFQAEHVRTWRALRGNDFLFSDDFTGGQLDLGLWLPPQEPDLVRLRPDSVPGALGVARISPSDTGSNSISTNVLPLGALDWRLATRMRFPNYNSLAIAAECHIGLLNFFVGAELNIFRIARLPGASLNVTVLSGVLTAAVDTQVATPVNAYSTLEIRRQGNVLAFIIDDVIVAMVPYSVSISGAAVWISTPTPKGLQMNVDFVKLWVVRQPVSSLTA